VSRRFARVAVRLPVELLARAREEADRCGVSVREYVVQTVHAGLAARLCSHADRVAEPPAPSEPSEPGEAE
jgi:hypothetical protein